MTNAPAGIPKIPDRVKHRDVDEDEMKKILSSTDALSEALQDVLDSHLVVACAISVMVPAEGGGFLCRVIRKGETATVIRLAELISEGELYESETPETQS